MASPWGATGSCSKATATCSALVVAWYSVRVALTPVWLTACVDRAGVAGKTALKPESVATNGVGAGVGVVVEFDDVPPQAVNPIAAASAPPASRLDMPTRTPLPTDSGR